MTIRILKEFIQGVFVNRKKEEDIVDDYTEKLSIKMASRETLIQNLSGGNQQKVEMCIRDRISENLVRLPSLQRLSRSSM